MFNFFKKKDEDNIEAKGALGALKDAVSKTSKVLVQNVLNIVSNNDEIDEFVLDDIEASLIKADIGVDLALQIVENIKNNNIKPTGVKEFLKSQFEEILNLAGSNELKFDFDKLNIYFVTGVNGAGKTTLIGKLAYRMKTEGKKVLLAAGDTFRAAAEEQLDIWSKRADVDIVREDKADPASIVYRAIEKAKNENYNVLIIDTAGRLQNKFNLIEELKKIKGVIDKKAPDANFESILVLDANLGQNGLNQAKVFKEAVELTAVALTKLDGSSKGGVIFAIAKEYNLPVKLIGVGEKIGDLKNFNKDEFISAIF
ncbi:TPA: signal recognition particle-docking protein FtsY [Candidatus Galligastranaerophilus gallistercoris]|nr:signal recognition particle-docking protein FtsY [Candidatus Galligastranaerophilus gallistercoris]